MPIRYLVNKYQIIGGSWIVLWTNQYGKCNCEHFECEADADKFITGN